MEHTAKSSRARADDVTRRAVEAAHAATLAEGEVFVTRETIGRYRTIVADPPWPYRSPGGDLGASPSHRPNSWNSPRNGPGSVKRYGAMTMLELLALRPDADQNAHLFLWTTNAFMDEAHDVARAWGFAPKTIGTWVKTKPDGTPSMKTGHYLRGATEHFIIAVRGSLPFPKDKPYPTAFLWPRLPHSVKPDAFYDFVEDVSPGPYLELFARRQRLGWDTWGNEALNHVSLAPAETKSLPVGVPAGDKEQGT